MSQLAATNVSTQSSTSLFEQLLRSLCNDDRVFGEPAYLSIQRLLSFDGRLPLSHAWDSLLDYETYLITYLQDLPNLRIEETEHTSRHTKPLRIYYNGLGRLHVRSLDEPFPAYKEELGIYPIGYLNAPDALMLWAQKAASVGLREEELLRTQLDNFLATQEQNGALQEVIDAVYDAARHVEAVSFYVDDDFFSVVEGFTTLVDKESKSGLLSRIRQLPTMQWSPPQRVCVAGMYALFSSGKSVRFEEFNGKNMSARRLFARLNDLVRDYYTHGASLEREETSRLIDLATAVRTASEQSVGQAWLRYRLVNGLTFLKTERITLAEQDDANIVRIPENIVALFENYVGPFDNTLPYQHIFSALADSVIKDTLTALPCYVPNGPADSPLEELIQEIVTSAMLSVEADYGMSSSIRRPGALVADNERDIITTVLSLTPADFYCCITSRPGLQELLGDRIQRHIYAAVQGRMQFNRWHFIPGNFDRSKIPSNRHFFYPPLLPDLAEWSDHHHAGHTRAPVRYSIRCPGPDMNLQPLQIAAHSYRGFYDIRVVRMDGTPFTLKELHTVRRHCLWMGEVWKRISNACTSHKDALCIRGFAKGQGYEPHASR